jgi:hypothetical protein
MQVICPCNHERVNTDAVEFLDISEGLQGEDIVTFVCPFCGEEHASVVLGGGYKDNIAYWDEVETTARLRREAADQIYE